MNILSELENLVTEKSLSREEICDAFSKAISHGMQKQFGTDQKNLVEIDMEKGAINCFCVYQVVEEKKSIINEISLDDARKINKNAAIGEEIRVPHKLEDLGRLAIQVVKQVFIQMIRELEREIVFKKYYNQKSALFTFEVTFIAKSRDNERIVMGLIDNKIEGYISQKEQIPRESVRVGDRLKAVLIDVDKRKKGVDIVLSRVHPELLAHLFRIEVPEIRDGIIEIKSTARDPGKRSKIAVFSSNNKIDAVGACVGQRGARVQEIVRELRGEKIDIVLYSDELETYIKNALAPAQIVRVIVDADRKGAVVIVDKTQLSLAIGKEGQNVRLAVKLLKMKINIMTDQDQREKEIMIAREALGQMHVGDSTQSGDEPEPEKSEEKEKEKELPVKEPGVIGKKASTGKKKKPSVK